jgi:hypothetical protein
MMPNLKMHWAETRKINAIAAILFTWPKITVKVDLKRIVRKLFIIHNGGAASPKGLKKTNEKWYEPNNA